MSDAPIEEAIDRRYESVEIDLTYPSSPSLTWSEVKRA